MVYTINLVDDTTIKKYIIEFVNNHIDVKLLKSVITGITKGFNEGSRINEEEFGYLDFENLSIEEKADILETVLKEVFYTDTINIMPYEKIEENLDVIL